MATVSELCRLLHNPLRLRMLVIVYSALEGGMNVGLLADELSAAGLNQSGVRQYLKQLAHIGVIRRERAGRYINYLADRVSGGAKVAEAVRLIVGRVQEDGDFDFARFLGVLMNPFRAAVITYRARGGAGDPEAVCAVFQHQRQNLRRDLRMALDEGLLSVDDLSAELGVYSFVASSAPLVARLVELCM